MPRSLDISAPQREDLPQHSILGGNLVQEKILNSVFTDLIWPTACFFGRWLGIHLYIVYSCLYAKLSICDREHTGGKA